MNNYVADNSTNGIYPKLPIISYYAQYDHVAYDSGTLVVLNNQGKVEVFGKLQNCSSEIVKTWTNVISVAVDPYCIFGLKNDGTVVYCGTTNSHDDCLTWYNIVSLKSIGGKVFGITADGKLMISNIPYLQKQIDKWDDIIHVHAKYEGIIALRKNGQIYYIGEKGEFCDYSVLKDYWVPRNYTEVVFLSNTVVALEANGTVFVYTYDEKYNCWLNTMLDSNSWQNICHLSAEGCNLFAIKKDGTVVHNKVHFSGYNPTTRQFLDSAFYFKDYEFTNLLSVLSTSSCFIGITENGNLFWSGYDINYNLIPDASAMPNSNGTNYAGFVAVDVTVFNDINKLSTILNSNEAIFEEKRVAKNQEVLAVEEQKKKERQEKKEREQKKQEELQRQYRSLGVCQHCGNKFKGFFTKTCISCGKTRDY